QDLINEGHLNAPLLYNLGNASYRLERSGEAALWYERALILDPSFKEARQNLRFVRRSDGSLEFDEGDSQFLTRAFKRDSLVRIVTSAGWLAALGFVAVFSLRLGNGVRKVLWLASPLLALIALAAAAGLLLKQKQRADLGQRAIIVAADTKAFTAPSRSAGTIIDLPPGSQVASVSERGNWHYIDVPGELRGWIPNETMSSLWPYDSALAD
ncbi:MAG: tetratricopeptide repeat protein, partial [Verrucomicrobiales bacterium]